MKRFGTFELAFGAGVLGLVTLSSMAAPPPPSSMEREIRIIRVPRDGQGAPQELAIDDPAAMLAGIPMGMPPVARATLGVLLAPPTEGASAAAGVAVEAVTPGGGAALAGVQPGDRLLTVNGRKVATSAEVVAVMAEVKPGEAVKVESLRDGKPRNFEVVSQQREARVMIIREDGGSEGRGPQGPGGMQSPLVFMQGGPMEGVPERVEVTIDGPLAELELALLTPALGRYFGTDKGVLVVRANDALKLQDGDVLRAIGGRAPTDDQHAMRILGSYTPGEIVKLDVLRDRKPLLLEVAFPAKQAGPLKRRVRVQVGPPPAP